MAPIYSQGAIGAFLVFDVTTRASLEHISNWQKCLESCDPHVCVMVLGNKADCENREVQFAEGEAVAQEFGYDYAETSAKTGAGVEDAFINLTEKAIEARSVKAGMATELQLTPRPAQQKKEACC
jgi:GTPase SAR1 family protein